MRKLIALAFLSVVSGYCAITASRVLVVYQANGPDKDGDGTPDSLQLAKYYMLKRGVPSSNMLGISPTVATSYTDYAKFQSEVLGPIKAKLTQLGTTNIDVILLAGVLPYGVTNVGNRVASMDSAIMGPYYWNLTLDTISQYPNPYGASTVAKTPSFGPDAPRFSHAAFNFNLTPMYLVSHLGADDALRGMDQLDQDLYAERYFSLKSGYYSGVGYVDSYLGVPGKAQKYTDAWLTANVTATDPSFSTYSNADVWIAYSEHLLTVAGVPLQWENTTNNISIGSPGATWSDGTPALVAPNAFLYAGWYNFDRYNDVWDWLPGSVACDLNSAPYFGRQAAIHGASNVSYVVGEPYLSGHQRPNILLYYILRGFTFAEAATLSAPSIGWMNFNDGDPLYAPFAPRMPAVDTKVPVLAAGFPTVSLKAGSKADWVVKIVVSDSPEPEVVRAQVDFGTTTSYGSTATSGRGYWRRPSVVLANLVPNVLYHYQVTMVDPVGNVTKTGDLTFPTGSVPVSVPCTATLDAAKVNCSASYVK